MAVLAFGNTRNRSTLCYFNSAGFSLDDIVRQSTKAWTKQLVSSRTKEIFCFIKEIESLRCGSLEADDVVIFAGIHGEGKRLDEETAFKNQIAFLFFGIFRQSDHNQIVNTFGHCDSINVAERQSVFNFAIFGV